MGFVILEKKTHKYIEQPYTNFIDHLDIAIHSVNFGDIQVPQDKKLNIYQIKNIQTSQIFSIYLHKKMNIYPKLLFYSKIYLPHTRDISNEFVIHSFIA